RREGQGDPPERGGGHRGRHRERGPDGDHARGREPLLRAALRIARGAGRRAADGRRRAVARGAGRALMPLEAQELGLLWGALLAAGVAAGFVNTLAGGGSLLTLPALMLLGLPANVANGTNRLAVAAQSLSGVIAFHRQGKLD